MRAFIARIGLRDRSTQPRTSIAAKSGARYGGFGAECTEKANASV